ncbi:LysM peptidoglycan-binding domain-containing protein [candidate division KSB1 bacterium]
MTGRGSSSKSASGGGPFWLWLPLIIAVLALTCSPWKPFGARHSGPDADSGAGEGWAEVNSDSFRRYESALRLYHRGRTLYRYGQFNSAQDHLERSLDLLAELELSASDPPGLALGRDHLVEQAGELRSWIEDRMEAMALSDIELRESRPPPFLVEDTGTQYNIKLEYNSRVQVYIDLYCGRLKNTFSLHLARGGKYEAMMRRILAEEGVPTDIVYVCLIESGYNPRAYSRAHAVGPWQFIGSSAKIFKLKTDWWVDERRDPEKSTRAGARYLKSLHTRFGSWPLAMAAYNTGALRVRRAMRRVGTDDFWKLPLSRQTRRYVPKFMASMMIAKNPEGDALAHTVKTLAMLDIQYHEPDQVDVVSIPQCTDLKLIAECSGAPIERIKELNPELRRWCTPPETEGYRLRLPRGRAGDFWANYDKIPKKKLVTFGHYRVKRGDTVSGIADRFGTSVAAVASTNNLNNRHLIQPGQELVIPGRGSISVLTAGKQADSRSPVAATTNAPNRSGDKTTGRKLIYTVKKRDTLYDIARLHGTTVARLRSWNRVDRGYLIRPGDKLTLYLRPAAAPSSSDGAAGLGRDAAN